ncbi:hypothetical protein [Leisingera sp. ANG-S5]|uniref:hypothetical protein n=1 Tax=Leisingera sp. ANG-S5 TaxID=1577901 RepID=UPI00126A6587|nr:hypothetical protein [Leisingera sp. ANG-S5]
MSFALQVSATARTISDFRHAKTQIITKAANHTRRTALLQSAPWMVLQKLASFAGLHSSIAPLQVCFCSPDCLSTRRSLHLFAYLQ